MSSALQNKMLNYEVQPPQGVWSKIAASLDENISPALSEKLYQFEEEPPFTVWNNINTRLDQDSVQPAKVIPFFVKHRRPLKYSGAVAIFIFLATVTSLLISKRTETEVPGNGSATTHTTTIKRDTVKESERSKEKDSRFAGMATEKKPRKLIAKSKVARAGIEQAESSFSLAENLLPKQAERNEIVNTSISSDKYMIYSDGDGNVIRLPKKIFNAFACPTDNLDCKERLQKLREKFAASAVTADFTGLLEILKSLQENQ